MTARLVETRRYRALKDVAKSAVALIEAYDEGLGTADEIVWLRKALEHLKAQEGYK
jgi:hypothetical protein